jgi:2,5-dihydroxypyridine 5,6-dioxygenase
MNTMGASLLTEARMIVRQFVKVVPGELVAVVADRPRREEGEALAVAAEEAGTECLLIDMTRQVERLLTSKGFWIRPPQHLVEAVQASQVAIFAVDETYAFRLDHHVREIFETGPDCSIFKVDLGMGTWGITDATIQEIEETGRRILQAFAGADHVRVTSPAGTDLSLSIRGRQCLPVMPVPERGMPYGTPIPLWGEYNWAPVEGSVNGTLVIDGISEATTALHVVDEPVSVTIVAGKVTDVQGGEEAEAFSSVFAIDEGASQVGELGIGGNPIARPGTETEKALLGTIHVGFGNNDEYPGGMVRSEMHVDGGVRHATVEVDGRMVLRDGKLAV